MCFPINFGFPSIFSSSFYHKLPSKSFFFQQKRSVNYLTLKKKTSAIRTTIVFNIVRKLLVGASCWLRWHAVGVVVDCGELSNPIFSPKLIKLVKLFLDFLLGAQTQYTVEGKKLKKGNTKNFRDTLPLWSRKVEEMIKKHYEVRPERP